jgi:cytochrome c-type biogenesis protein CcmF
VALLLGLILAVYGLVSSAIGARRGHVLLVESGRTTAYSLLAVVVAANGAMLAAILANDFSLNYVAENSSRSTPVFFKVLSLWSADEGSLLLWNLILAAYIALVAFRFRRRRPETFPWAMAVMYAVSAFYLLLVLGPTSPFERLSAALPDGRGPLPLLQNHPLMAVHPPFLYLGFIGFTVPFAFAMAALITGRLSDAWIRLTRRWTLAAWIFLTVGLILGALWSYGVLGWGGYWAWDPVENVALLPWLAATAFLHSVVIQERRGMLKVWNLSLIVGAFALTTFGTFLTRGSILSSVHAFAQSLVGPMYLGFLVLVLVGGFGLIATRSWRLRSEGRFDSALSREAAFLGNNLVLLALTFIVLLGTIFPLVVEALTNRQSTVGGPYFVQTTVPLFLLLLFLMGIGPLLPWRRASSEQLRNRVTLPAAAGAAVVVGLALAGVRNLAAVAAFGMAAFVAVANGTELVRGVRAYRRATGRPRGRAAIQTVIPNRPQ